MGVFLWVGVGVGFIPPIAFSVLVGPSINPPSTKWQTKGKAMTDIDIESLQSEFLRLELLVNTAFDCAESEVEAERNAALACLNAAQHSAQVFREMLFTDA